MEKRNPAAAPSPASSRLSVINCRITRRRPAPIAMRDREFPLPHRRARQQQVPDADNFLLLKTKVKAA